MPSNETMGPIWLGVSTSLMALLLITTALRLWVRFGRRNLGWDDYTITVAATTAAMRYAFGVMQLSHGYGRHRVYLGDYDYTMVTIYGWWGQLLHFTSMAFLKVSLCLLILRIQSNRALKVLLYVVMGVSLVTNLAVVLILLVECRPAGFWRGSSAQCWPRMIRIYTIWTSIACSVLSDLLCSFLPLAVVWKIQIPSQTKLMVTGLMSLGLVATGFGIVRAESIGVSQGDPSWDFCITAIWSNAELFLGISAANLALSRAIHLYFFPPNDSLIATERCGPLSNEHIHDGFRSACIEGPAAIISSSQQQNRVPSSDVPLGPGIRKKTDFWWTLEGE